MKIIILGSKGSLGQQLVKVFQDKNEIIAWDHNQVDVTDQELVTNKIHDIKPNLIINASAYNAVDRCEDNEEEFKYAKKVNGLAPGYIARAALDVSAFFVHYSSDYVFDGRSEDGYLEKDIPRPINKYGETKLLGEKEILKLTGDGLKCYIIRTSKLFGPKGLSEKVKNNFFDIMLSLAKEKKGLRVVDEEISCFTYTPDLAVTTRKMVDEKLGFGVYHIVNAEACTWYKAAEALFEILNMDVSLQRVSSDEFPRPAKRPKNAILLNKKIPQLRSFKEALEDYLKL